MFFSVDLNSLSSKSLVDELKHYMVTSDKANKHSILQFLKIHEDDYFTGLKKYRPELFAEAEKPRVVHFFRDDVNNSGCTRHKNYNCPYVSIKKADIQIEKKTPVLIKTNSSKNIIIQTWNHPTETPSKEIDQIVKCFDNQECTLTVDSTENELLTNLKFKIGINDVFFGDTTLYSQPTLVVKQEFFVKIYYTISIHGSIGVDFRIKIHGHWWWYIPYDEIEKYVDDNQTQCFNLTKTICQTLDITKFVKIDNLPPLFLTEKKPNFSDLNEKMQKLLNKHFVLKGRDYYYDGLFYFLTFENNKVCTIKFSSLSQFIDKVAVFEEEGCQKIMTHEEFEQFLEKKIVIFCKNN